MNWLQKLIIGKEIAKLEQKYNRALYPNLQPGVKYPVQNGRFISPPDNMTTFIRDGYSMNDIVYSVVNIILDKIRLPEWSIYKVVDESSLKKYRSLIQRKNLTGREYKKALQLKDTALQPINNYSLQLGKLKDLLTYPNDYCTFQDLVGELIMFKLLTGNGYLWGTDILQNGANAGIPNTINILPAQFMNIKVTEAFPAEPYTYLLYNPWNIEFPVESILHNKYANPNWDINGQQLYGMSPLKAALKNICRNNSAKDASTAKFQNGGLEEIIFMDDERFNAVEGVDQMKALKVQLATEYGGPTNQGKVAISGYKVGKIGLGLSPVELAIIESEKWDAIMICNIYGIPADLIVPEHRTFNNAKEAEKALTTRSALPLLTSFRNDLNRKVMGDWGGFGGIFIDYDIQCFTELQTDLNETADWTSKVIAISPNDQLEFLGQERYKDPMLDEPWVMQNGSRVPLSDFQANPIDNILNQMANGTGNTSGANGNGAGQGNQSASNGKVSQNGVGKNMSH